MPATMVTTVGVPSAGIASDASHRSIAGAAERSIAGAAENAISNPDVAAAMAGRELEVMQLVRFVQ